MRIPFERLLSFDSARYLIVWVGIALLLYFFILLQDFHIICRISIDGIGVRFSIFAISYFKQKERTQS